MAEKKLNNEQISIFCNSIAMMLHAGATVGEACSLFAGDEKGLPAETARAMTEEIEMGTSFADAAQNTGVFPAYALGVFRTAEVSGRLDSMLFRLAGYYERQEGLNRRFESALTYPAVLLLFMCGVLSVLIFGVLPMFEKVYTNLTGSLAASSYAYVAAAAVIGRISLAAAAIVTVLLLGLALTARSASGKEKLRRPMEQFFFTRQVSRKLAVSKLADTLSTLMASGIDQDTALEMAMELAEHDELHKVLEQTAEQMRCGGGLAESLFRSGAFPSLYGRMLIGGNESGNLGAALEEISDRLGKDAEMELIGLMDSVEPVLIGFLTISVGLTLLSVMLPLLGILGAV